MATLYSDQITNQLAVPPKMNKKNEFGKVYRAFFSHTTPAVPGIGDVLQLVKLPAGARVVGGRLTGEATAATATIAIGDAGSATRFYPATAAGASELDITFASKISTNYGYEYAAETVILLTNGTAAFTAAKKMWGHVDFIF